MPTFPFKDIEFFTVKQLPLVTLKLFVVLACHWPVLDGFDQRNEATVHFPLSSAVDEPQQHRQFCGGSGGVSNGIQVHCG